MGDLINNIGPPFENTSVFVLDPDSDAILPRGAVGELCFGGEQVFRGYLNRPELNAAKLLNIAPYGRVYRSGDMGRLLPDDCILSAGRSDDQVKIRGQRVELGEITSIILDDKDIADCATLLLASETGVKTLVTFWVQRDCESKHFRTADAWHSQTAVLRIAESLSRQLPVYMLPTYLIAISKIPMTAQGKIDKRVLQATFSNLTDAELTQYAPGQMNMDRANNGSSSAATSLSAWEEDVAKALAHLLELEVEQIRPTTSFFNLGLDSVSAIRFCHCLRQLNIADFTVAEVLKNSTITRLGAVHMSQAASPKPNANSPNKPQDVFTEEQRSAIVAKMISHGIEVEKIAPCTPLQEAMLSSSAPAGAAYNNTKRFTMLLMDRTKCIGETKSVPSWIR